MFRILWAPVAALVVALGYVLLSSEVCRVPEHVRILEGYSPKTWDVAELVLEKPRFVMRDVVERRVKVEIRIPDIVKRMKVSVLEAGKQFLLINGFFVEKGKSINGVKFLGVKNGEVLIEVEGRVYKKRM